MFIWRVTRPGNSKAGWDEYIGFVAVAPDEAAVRLMYPSDAHTPDGGRYKWSDSADGWTIDEYPDAWVVESSGWIRPSEVVVELLGVAHDVTQRVVMSDYKSG